MSDRERWGHEGFEELMREEHSSFYQPKHKGGYQRYQPKHFKSSYEWHKPKPKWGDRKFRPKVEEPQRLTTEVKLHKPRFIFKKKEESHDEKGDQDDVFMSGPTQPSPSDLGPPRDFTPPESAFTPPPLEPPSQEFNPVLLQVKIQTERGPIDVAIRQLDEPLHVAHQLCR